MINQLMGFVSSQHQRLAFWQLPLTGLLLTVGLIGNTSIGEKAAAQEQAETVDTTAVAIAQAQTSTASIADGVYLYGQSSEPEQIGTEYIVFEADHGKLLGALYLPNSEFSCFYGTLDSNQMNLTVVNPYDQTALSHTIARAQPQSIAAARSQPNLGNTYESLTYPHTVSLEGYQPVGKLSDNDKRILSTCRESYQERVGN
ncbi:MULTISPECIES: hypothetical protein [unclassified Coleofasciculus]|uniref:hypothetical protein n=1 Tax=unclassified Coleofasciculus TaxID=2692782 RepID=UPI001881A894|nr:MULTISPECIES: hypothetical protein [unclassified Coleofasciculus]MBE9127840.1 hypothetical protein [Coleofasciculus sp. LEGE 07081]MBE9148084.1 hypothetical protein [Coleofasciculus sp. LEGE 07092]